VKDETARRRAVALGYNDLTDEAPRILATGKGCVAEEIINVAKQHNIPIYEDEKIVGLLERLDLGDYIPRQLYMAVAEILCFTMELEAHSGNFLA
jgi:flagellar biosynthesis protein